MDRYKSKKVVKQLKIGHGSPGEKYRQDLWVRRFDTFREHKVRQELNSSEILAHSLSHVERHTAAPIAPQQGRNGILHTSRNLMCRRSREMMR